MDVAEGTDDFTGETVDTSETLETEPDLRRWYLVTVTLDGEPAPGTLLIQGGRPETTLTNESGMAMFEVDLSLDGEIVVIASHPEARIRGFQIWPGQEETAFTISLTRYDPTDNPDYKFIDPGEPERRDTTNQCGHCHNTLNDDWFESNHRTSASNPAVQDLYAGVASSVQDEVACQSVGGSWRQGLEPGTREPVMRCYVGDGVLPALNPGCEVDGSCDEAGEVFGGCADCHAPGIDGELGGRDLLQATGHAYDYGVHCDICHRVDALDETATEPGMAGWFKVLRPLEKSPNPALGFYKPLTFGPSHDSPNVKMGSVQRDHFHESAFCAGCHQLDQPALVPGTSLDPTRWPDGRLPVQSTYQEWVESPMNPAAPCQSCHMPPDPLTWNHADLQIFNANPPGLTAGWHRPPGTTRRHLWVGPRQPESRMLQLAAAVFIDKTVAEGELVASVRVKNVGPGHAIPTGEPLRSMFLVVQARCGETTLEASGGAAIADIGGYADRQDSTGDWSQWPGASEGDRIRVIARPGGYWDPPGTGPFGDGTFTPEQKGLPVEVVVGQRQVIGVDGDTITLDSPLPEGDVAYRVSAEDVADGLPAHQASSKRLAGRPGVAFARVMEDAQGRRMVPHFLAVDVASDNRLPPQASWTSEHRFAATCEEPVVDAVLLYRPWPITLAAERGWVAEDARMVEVSR
ncbi:MAG: hypothetical protein VX938_08270 [Myxococcota bacterium]|nr:hypothetical protein [Myxococcota bacterium]